MRIATYIVCLLCLLSLPVTAQKTKPDLNTVFKAAVEAQRQGKLEAAKAGFKTVLHMVPNHAPSHINLATIYLQQGDSAKFDYHLKQAMANAGNDSDLWLRIASLRVGQMNPAEAEKALTKVKGPSRETAMFYAVRGAIRTMGRDFPSAVSDLKKSLAKNPGDRRTIIMLAKCEVQLKKYDDAIARLRPLTAKYPKDAIALQGLAEAYLSKDDKPNAVPVLEKLHAIVPAEISYGILLARTYEDTGKLEKGVDLLGKMIKEYPVNVLLRIEQGDMFSRNQYWAEAEQQYNYARQLKPKDPDIETRYATVSMKLGRYPEAIEQFKAMLRTDPTNTQAFVGLEEIYQGQHADNLLIQLYRERMKNVPNDPYASLQLGILYKSNRDYDAARREFERHVNAYPGDASGHREYGNLLAALGQREIALGEYQACVAIAKDDTLALQQIGDILFDLNRDAEGVAHFEGLKKRFPKDARSWSALANHYEKVKKPELAEKEYRDLAVRQPNYQPAKVELARLLEAHKDVDGALALFEELVKMSKNPSKDFGKIPDLLYRNGRKEEAAKRWAQEVAAHPTDTLLRSGYGQFLVAEGKFDDAITQFKEVKRLTPNDIYPRMKLADIYDEQKKDAEWLEEVNGILEMNADEMAPYSMLQRHLLAKGEPEKYWDMILPYAKRGTAQDLPLQRLVEFAPQVKKLDEAVEIARARVNAAPTSKGAWLALAQGLQSQEKWTDAIDAYARASRLDPTNMTAIRSYALTAEDHGTKKQAVDAYKLYTDSYPTDAWGLLKYGNVLRADGQNGLALDIFRKVLERFPDNETAIKAVKELENSR